VYPNKDAARWVTRARLRRGRLAAGAERCRRLDHERSRHLSCKRSLLFRVLPTFLIGPGGPTLGWPLRPGQPSAPFCGESFVSSHARDISRRGGLCCGTQPSRWTRNLWWHIKTGESLLNTHHWPTVDSYSFTVLGQPWIAGEWLGDAVIAFVARQRRVARVGRSAHCVGQRHPVGSLRTRSPHRPAFPGNPWLAQNCEGIGVYRRPMMCVEEAFPCFNVPPQVRVHREGASRSKDRPTRNVASMAGNEKTRRRTEGWLSWPQRPPERRPTRTN